MQELAGEVLRPSSLSRFSRHCSQGHNCPPQLVLLEATTKTAATHENNGRDDGGVQYERMRTRGSLFLLTVLHDLFAS
eukprot:11967861-Alexandrium_andersonii.AAC.1